MRTNLKIERITNKHLNGLDNNEEVEIMDKINNKFYREKYKDKEFYTFIEFKEKYKEKCQVTIIGIGFIDTEKAQKICIDNPKRDRRNFAVSINENGIPEVWRLKGGMRCKNGRLINES